jgi:hypothetical protein
MNTKRQPRRRRRPRVKSSWAFPARIELPCIGKGQRLVLHIPHDESPPRVEVRNGSKVLAVAVDSDRAARKIISLYKSAL